MVDGDRSWASGAYDSLAPAHRAELLRIAAKEEERERVPVPTTAIYSRTDGIVRWHTCIDTVAPEHENVEVRGSHSGLGAQPDCARGHRRPARAAGRSMAAVQARALGGGLLPAPGDWRPSPA